jgi:hypothetical protein
MANRGPYRETISSIEELNDYRYNLDNYDIEPIPMQILDDLFRKEDLILLRDDYGLTQECFFSVIYFLNHRSYTSIKLNLTNIELIGDYSNIKLANVDFSNSYIHDAFFINSTLFACTFTNTTFDTVDFTSSVIGGVDFRNAIWDGPVIFKGCEFEDMIDFDNNLNENVHLEGVTDAKGIEPYELRQRVEELKDTNIILKGGKSRKRNRIKKKNSKKSKKLKKY